MTTSGSTQPNNVSRATVSVVLGFALIAFVALVLATMLLVQQFSTQDPPVPTAVPSPPSGLPTAITVLLESIDQTSVYVTPPVDKCPQMLIKAFVEMDGTKYYMLPTHPYYSLVEIDAFKYPGRFWFCTPVQALVNGYHELPTVRSN